MALAVPGIPTLDEDRTALSVMTHILGGGMSSRLFHTVRERNGLAYSIFAHHESLEDTGIFAIATGTRPKDAARAVRALLRGAAQDRRPPGPGDRAGRRQVGDDRPAAAIHRDRDGERPLLRRALAGPAAPGDARPARRGDRQVTVPEVQRVAERIAAGIDEVRLAFVGPSDQGEALLDAALDRRAG